MFPCTEHYRFPISPLLASQAPVHLSQRPKVHTPLLPSSLNYHLHRENLSISNPLELSLRSWAFSFSHKLLSVVSPLLRSEPRRLEGIYHVVICANICCCVSFSFRFMDSCRDFVYMCILSPSLRAEQGENTLVCEWVNIGEESLEAWLFLEVDVNKLINWAAGVAESSIRRLPRALFLHPVSLFPSERGLHSWTPVFSGCGCRWGDVMFLLRSKRC